jgi:hypothetical protein
MVAALPMRKTESSVSEIVNPVCNFFLLIIVFSSLSDS